MAPDRQRPPDKLPDPWLFDSEALLEPAGPLPRTADLLRHSRSRAPNATHFGIQNARSTQSGIFAAKLSATFCTLRQRMAQRHRSAWQRRARTKPLESRSVEDTRTASSDARFNLHAARHVGSQFAIRTAPRSLKPRRTRKSFRSRA